MESINQRNCSHYRSSKWLLGFIIEAIVFGLFIWGWYLFVFEIGMNIMGNQYIKSIILIVIYHMLVVMSIFSLIRTTFTDPGSVPRNFLEYASLFETTSDGSARYCSHCKQYKPDRARHCSDCKTCVLKMDHHCPWVNNCVGYRNYKFFCLFVFYTSLLCIFVAISCGTIIFTELDFAKLKGSHIQVVVMAFISGAFAFTLIAFSIAHLKLVLQNLTTIESMFDNATSKNIYDLGPKKNWKQVFGNNPLLYFIPVSNSLGDGLTWEVNDRAPIVPVRIEDLETTNNTEDEKSKLL